MSAHFNERNSKLARALVSLDPKIDTFYYPKTMQPLLHLTNSTILDNKCSVEKQHFATVTGGNDKMTASRLISEHHGVLKAMPSVLHALKLSVTLGASTAICENSFSALKNIFVEENRRATVHSRKAPFVQLAFERDLTEKLSGEWKDKVLQKVSAAARRLQLFKKSNCNVVKLYFSVSVRLVSFRQTLRSHDSFSTIFSNKRRLPVENEKSVIKRTILMWKGRTW